MWSSQSPLSARRNRWMIATGKMRQSTQSRPVRDCLTFSSSSSMVSTVVFPAAIRCSSRQHTTMRKPLTAFDQSFPFSMWLTLWKLHQAILLSHFHLSEFQHNVPPHGRYLWGASQDDAKISAHKEESDSRRRLDAADRNNIREELNQTCKSDRFREKGATLQHYQWKSGTRRS